MTAFDAIDTTREVDESIYTRIVQAIASKASLRYTLENAITKKGAYMGIVKTFNLEASVEPLLLVDLQERLGYEEVD